MIFVAFTLLTVLGLSNAQNATVAPPPDPVNATEAPTTQAQTTEAPTTQAQTTEAPTTQAPTTEAPTTQAPTTEAPTTQAPTTEAPTTQAPTTEAPTTQAPTTEAPTTQAPTTEAPTTQAPPRSLSVVCTYEEMIVYLDHSYHPNLNLDSISLRDASCNLGAGEEYGNYNGSHVWLMVPFDSCGTTHTTTDDHIIYNNSMIAETRASAGSILISREFQAEFPFQCSYPRSAIVSVASFSPREKVVYTSTAELGNFTFLMDMYESDEYEAPYDSYPVQVDLDQTIYLEVKVVSNDSMLVLFPDRCWATPSSDLEDSKLYAFIEEGCNKDETLVYDYEESATQRFSLTAFRFLGESADSVVYLHCSVEACRKGNADSRCAKGCEENGRKRRDLYLDAASIQTVSIGPVTAIDSSKEKAKVTSDGDSGISLTVIATIAGVLGVVVLLLIVALLLLYKRFKAPQYSARVVYSKTSTEEKNRLV